MPASTLGYSGVLFTDRRNFYPSPQMVAQLYPAATPFYSSVLAFESSRGGAQQIDDKDFKMFEHRNHWRYQTAEVNEANPSSWSGSGTPGETVDVTLDGFEGVNYNDALIGQYVDIWDKDGTTNKGRARIQGLTSNSNEVTLKALGKPTASDFAVDDLEDDDVLYFVSSAFGEGDDAPEADDTEMDVVYNSVERHRTTVEVTKDLQKANLRARRKQLSFLRNEKQKEHNMKAARAFLWGIRNGGIGGTAHGAGGTNDTDFVKDSGNVLHIDDAQGRTVTTTMGYITALQRYGKRDDTADDQNYFSLDGQTADFVKWVDVCDKLGQYADAGVRDAFVGSKVMSWFSTKAASNNNGWDITISDQQTSRIGFQYRVLETPHLTLRLTKLPLLRRTPYQNMMLLPHMDFVGRAQFEPDQYSTNIKTDNNPDLVKDEFTSWHGLKLRLMERHALVDFDNLVIGS